MDDLSSLSQGVLALGILIFVLLVIVMPISAYSGQKHAYHCLLELRKLNALLEGLRTTLSTDKADSKS